MPKVSDYTRTRIEVLDKQGLPPVAILRSLKNEGLSASLASVTRIIKKLRTTGSVANLPRSGRPKKLSEEAKTFIDQQMLDSTEDNKFCAFLLLSRFMCFFIFSRLKLQYCDRTIKISNKS